jgi:hypothetical protein
MLENSLTQLFGTKILHFSHILKTEFCVIFLKSATLAAKARGYGKSACSKKVRCWKNSPTKLFCKKILHFSHILKTVFCGNFSKRSLLLPRLEVMEIVHVGKK